MNNNTPICISLLAIVMIIAGTNFQLRSMTKELESISSKLPVQVVVTNNIESIRAEIEYNPFSDPKSHTGIFRPYYTGTAELIQFKENGYVKTGWMCVNSGQTNLVDFYADKIIDIKKTN